MQAARRRAVFKLLGGVSLALTLTLTLAGCAGTRPGSPGHKETGIASYYAHKFHGRATASGEIYDETLLTAAHRKFPFGTVVRVTRLDSETSVVVRINDRGPWVKGRIIDLSYAAAQRLDMIREGLVKVEVEVLP